MTNCPNCAAVLSYEGGLHCDYCGARFEKPELVVKVYSPAVDDDAMRSVALGLLTVNETRQLVSSDWPSTPTVETR